MLRPSKNLVTKHSILGLFDQIKPKFFSASKFGDPFLKFGDPQKGRDPYFENCYLTGLVKIYIFC